MSASVVGIDLGNAGALALVRSDGLLVDVADMPILRDGPAGRPSVNAVLLADILAKWHAEIVYVEFVSAWPKEGAVGAFSFGRWKGCVEGVAAALGLPVAFVTPPSWKRLVGIAPGRDGAKDAARSEAIRRWPGKASLFARIRERAEAALIALPRLFRERSP
jgi:crossover junction endodeoxyribonuclease RuvC